MCVDVNMMKDDKKTDRPVGGKTSVGFRDF